MVVIFEKYLRARILGDLSKHNINSIFLTLEFINIDNALKKQMQAVQNELDNLNTILDERIFKERKQISKMIDVHFDEADIQNLTDKI